MAGLRLHLHNQDPGPGRRRRIGRAGSVLGLGLLALLSTTTVALPAQAATSGTTAPAGRALINADTVSGGTDSFEAKAAVKAGLAVDVVTGAQWGAMSAAQFGSYQVLIAGDPYCGVIAPSFSDNIATWAPVVLGRAGGRTQAGNRVAIGTDPVLHGGGHPGGYTLIQDGVNYASAQPGRTGLYFDTSCGGNYYDQPGLAASLLQQVSTGTGSWTENDGPPCGGHVAKIASTAKFDSLHSSDIEGWGCSVHETFPTFASDWSALAVATDAATKPVCGTDTASGAKACGEAYVLIAGSDIVVTSPDVVITPSSTGPAVTGGTYALTTTVAPGGTPAAGVPVTFTVSGVNTGVSGTCTPMASCATDSAGKVTFSYPDTSGAGDDTVTTSYTAADGSKESATAAVKWVHPTVAVGNHPQGVAVSPDGKQAYVTNIDGGTVSVITVATNAVAATITVGAHPSAVAFSPDGTQAYVTDGNSADVSVITVATGVVSRTITVGSNSYGVVFTPNGKKAYVSNFTSNTVSVITVATGVVSKTITVGKNPVGVAVSADGTQAGVTNFGDGTLSGINALTDTVSATIKAGSKPWSGAVSPNGGKVYVSNMGSGTVTVLTAGSRTVSTITVGAAPWAAAVSPDGTKVYVTNSDSGTVSVIQVSTGTVVKTITVGAHPRAVAFSPDGKKAYVTDTADDLLTVVNT